MTLHILVECVVADVRWAFRSFGRAPASSAIAILSLALGIGANTAIFSMINALLWRPLPVPSPEELRLVVSNPSDPRVSWNYPDYLAFRDGAGMPLAAASGIRPVGLQRSDGAGDPAELARNQFVSGNYFSVLGVTPEIGRLFDAGDDRQPGAAPFAVLGFDYWHSRFGGDPGVIGRKVRANGYPITIVGVARRGFRGSDPTATPNFYVPLLVYSEVSRVPAAMWNSRRFWWLRLIGRVPRGTNLAMVETRLGTIAREQVEAERRVTPRAPARGQAAIALWPGASGYTATRSILETPLLILMALVAAVLLVACANVANVLLARGAGRAHELAIRMAVGAGRARIVSQLTTEGILMAVTGGALGLALAAFGSGPALARFLPEGRSGRAELDVSLDLVVLAFTTGLSLVTGLAAGLAPALRGARPSLVPALRASGGGASGSARAFVRRALVVGQVALSLVLVMAAALFARSLGNLQTQDPGFRRDQLAVAFVDPGQVGYTGQRLREFFERLRDDVERLPGVGSASLAAISPLEGMRWNDDFALEGAEGADAGDRSADMNAVGPRFFETMGIALVAGREFTEEDSPPVVPEPAGTFGRGDDAELPGPRHAIVNESFVRKYLGGRSPIGHRLSLTERFEAGQAYEIVGVARDVRYFGLREDPEPMVYVPVWRGALMLSLNLAIRTQGDVSGLGQAIRETLVAIDPAVPLQTVRTAGQQVDDDTVRERLVASLAGLFGGVALLLGSIGLYGVMSYLVARRTREIGIRVALGAGRPSVLWLVGRDAVVLVGAGLVVGGGAALGLGRLVRSLLFGIDAHDPTAAAVGVVALVAVAALAVAVPVGRALAIAPTEALREE